MTNEEYLSSIPDEHLRNIEEQLLLEKLAQVDNDDDDEQLIQQALNVIRDEPIRPFHRFNVGQSADLQQDFQSMHSNTPISIPKQTKKKDKYNMTTNEKIEEELSESRNLLDIIAAIVKWIDTQLLNAITGVVNQVCKLIYNIPKIVYNAFTKGIPYIFKKFGQFWKFVFSDKFMKLSFNIICLIPLLVLMIAVICWPFGIYFYVCNNMWWLIGSIAWTMFFGVYGAIQGWKHDVYGTLKNAVCAKVKKYNSDYFKSSNVLKRQITGEK